MTRRSFLKNIVGALAVLALPVAVKAAAEERISPYFRFETDPYAKRFNWTGEEWVQVEPESLRDLQFSKAYLNAAYEEIWLRRLPRIFA